MECNMTSCLWNCFIVALAAIAIYIISYIVLYVLLVREVNGRYSSDLVAQREQQLAAIN